MSGESAGESSNHTSDRSAEGVILAGRVLGGDSVDPIQYNPVKSNPIHQSIKQSINILLIDELGSCSFS